MIETGPLSTLQELHDEGKSLLKDYTDATLESKLLLLKSLVITEEIFYSQPDRLVSRPQAQRFYGLIAQRQLGMPLAYVIGEKEFWSLPFKVSSGVLIPRPETELIVEKVIEHAHRTEQVIADIGTGCGNIAVSLAKELHRSHLVATDISPKALEIARLNASLHRVPDIAFLDGSLYHPLKRQGLEGRCDFLVSNPPYVSEMEWETLPNEVRVHEPKSSLVPGETGLEIVQDLVSGAPVFLKRGGYLCIEIGFGQKEKAMSLFGAEWGCVDCFEDLGGIPRVIVARKNS